MSLYSSSLLVVGNVTVVIKSVTFVLLYNGGAVVIVSVSSKAWLLLRAVTVT